MTKVAIGFKSIPTTFLSALKASIKVVPPPTNGSKTKSLVFVKDLIAASTNTGEKSYTWVSIKSMSITSYSTLIIYSCDYFFEFNFIYKIRVYQN